MLKYESILTTFHVSFSCGHVTEYETFLNTKAPINVSVTSMHCIMFTNNTIQYFYSQTYWPKKRNAARRRRKHISAKLTIRLEFITLNFKVMNEHPNNSVTPPNPRQVLNLLTKSKQPLLSAWSHPLAIAGSHSSQDHIYLSNIHLINLLQLSLFLLARQLASPSTSLVFPQTSLWVLTL